MVGCFIAQHSEGVSDSFREEAVYHVMIGLSSSEGLYDGWFTFLAVQEVIVALYMMLYAEQNSSFS